MTEVIESMDNLKVKMKAVTVLYCGNCSMPFEYCEFGSKPANCKIWLKENNSELFAAIYNEGGEEEGFQEKAEPTKPNQKKKAAVQKKRIVITTVERTKRKRVTHVSGLELFGRFWRVY
jgi:density-regulated protein